ncbi:MAG: TolC family protein [Vulcanimicrobiaceae bacterium]
MLVFASSMLFLSLLFTLTSTTLAAGTGATPMPSAMPSASPLPYPAYGTARPDIIRTRVAPGVPPSITLAQAIAIAAARSPVFASAVATYEQTRAGYAVAKSAIFPNVSANVSASRTYASNLIVIGGSSAAGAVGANGMYTQDAAKVVLSQLIYDGGRVIAGIRSAQELSVAGRDTLDRALQTLAFTVATNYYGALQARSQVALDARIVLQDEEQEKLVQAQIRAGSAAPSDIYQQKFQTDQARATLIADQGAQIAALAAFATTLGLNPQIRVVPVENTPKNPAAMLLRSPVLDYGKAIARALLLRPDYLSALSTLESAQANLHYAKLAKFPSLTANASTGYQSTLPDGSKLRNAQSLGATLTIPIFDQGQTNYQVALAAAKLDQSKASLLQTRLQVYSDVRTALANLVSAQAGVEQAQAEVRSASVALAAAQAQYKVGVATLLDLVTAQVNDATGRTALLKAVYNLRRAEQQYRYALGTNMSAAGVK